MNLPAWLQRRPHLVTAPGVVLCVFYVLPATISRPSTFHVVCATVTALGAAMFVVAAIWGEVRLRRQHHR